MEVHNLKCNFLFKNTHLHEFIITFFIFQQILIKNHHQAAIEKCTEQQVLQNQNVS